MNNSDKAEKAYNKALKGINVKENEQIILECKNSWCYDFARDIHEANIRAHEKVILEIKNPEYSFFLQKIF